MKKYMLIKFVNGNSYILERDRESIDIEGSGTIIVIIERKELGICGKIGARRVCCKKHIVQESNDLEELIVTASFLVL